MTVTAPTVVVDVETAWDSAPSSRSTSGFDVQTGDLLVCVIMAANSNTTIATPTNSGTGLTWTAIQSITNTDYGRTWTYWAVVDNNRTGMTVSASRTSGSSDNWGMEVLGFRSHGGVKSSVKATASSGTPTDEISVNDHSLVIVAVTDWNEGALPTWDTSDCGTATEVVADNASTTFSIAYHADAGTSATKTIGHTSPSGQKYGIVGIEVAGTVQVSAGNATGTGAANQPTILAGPTTDALAGNASGAGTAYDASVSVTVTADVAEGAGQAISMDLGSVGYSGGVGQKAVYRVEVMDRGGVTLIGVLDGYQSITWSRIRDDISDAYIRLVGMDADDCRILRTLRAARHEVRIKRNNRVMWEGPITRIEMGENYAEIDARDVLWYASRRVYPLEIDYEQSPVSVLDVMDDVLGAVYSEDSGSSGPDPYNYNTTVTVIPSTDDARTAAWIPAYSATAWNLLDRYADDGGIDYTVVGRQVFVWDTHCRVAEAQKVSDGDFLDSLSVIEYGSEALTNVYYTNNNNTAVVASAPQTWLDYYGPLDQVQSRIDESTSTEEVPQERLDVMLEQAERMLSSGYPAPLVVRVPENVQLNPETVLRFADLIPGVHIPVETSVGCRPVRTVHKLTRVSVYVTPGEERVLVTMGPRPATVVEREDYSS